MKVPFFYLDIGDIQVFQPQNKVPVFSRDTRLRLQIESESCPEISGNTLFMNGRDRDQNFNICLNHNFDRSDSINKLIELLKTIEV